MNIHFDPILQLPIIFAFLVLSTAVVVISYRRYYSVISKSYWWILIISKFSALIIAVILLLNPQLIHREPDLNNLSVIVLIDDTGSMNTKDAEDGSSRIDFVKKSIINGSSTFYQKMMAKFENMHWFIFSGKELRRVIPGINFNSLPGSTDIDLILEQVLNFPVDQNSLGAVILVSDGLDNTGAALTEAVKSFKSRGIPVHCIGVGDPRSKADISIEWTKVPKESVKNESISLSATVAKNSNLRGSTKVHLFEKGRLLESKTVDFPDQKSQQVVSFDHYTFYVRAKSV